MTSEPRATMGLDASEPPDALDRPPPDSPEQGLEAGALGLEFSGEIFYWRGPAPFHFIGVPDDASAAVHAVASEVTYGWGMIPVRVRLGSSVWNTALWPKDGCYVVPIKDAVRRAEGLAAGDTAEVQLVVSPSRRRGSNKLETDR